MDNQEQIDCESNGGTWTEKDGAWVCVLPEESMDAPAPAAEGSEEEAM